MLTPGGLSEAFNLKVYFLVFTPIETNGCVLSLEPTLSNIDANDGDVRPR